MSADDKMESKICDFLRKNGKSNALVICKQFAVDKKLVNKHLYKLEISKKVFKTDGTPPLWDLLENKNEKTEEESWTTTQGSCEEEHVRKLLESGGMKASTIAGKLGLETKTVNKQLYSMRDEGKVQKCCKSNVWTLNDENQSDYRLASFSGLSQSFDVIKMLGDGGFGKVYEVKHKLDGKIYAVKEVVFTSKADLEVKALACLDHPNIVRYITCWPDCGNWTREINQLPKSDASSDVVTFERSGSEESVDDDDDDDDDDEVESGMASLSLNKPLSAAESSGDNSVDKLDPSNKTYLLIQMEFCEGGTLTSWIKARNLTQIQRSTVEINKIFHGIISGVEYIHLKKLIHRDLKPDNILFTADWKVKIGDFGLVAVQKNSSGDTIEWSKRKGTPPYMSPEQENKKKYNEKTDIFSLGLIWFEMLWKLSTGMERVKLWPDLRNRIFPDGFCDNYRTEHKFIQKMLSFTPEERPSAKDIRKKMEELLGLDQNILNQKTI